ncbi:hypothetical protein F5141DRAFT_1069312 [Pisolithus sp. B1]|nr:hypothetical protein F5141DRAFT_1069312 [Pisolithus sp. B1]
MDLDLKVAELGYKYHTDWACDPPHQLSDSEQLSEAFECGHQLMKWACGRQVILEIHNLSAAATELPVEVHAAQGETQLCTAHQKVLLLYITPTSDHDALDIYKLTSWAKSTPPEMNTFDHAPKQCHVSSGMSNVPAIHIHLPGSLDGRSVSDEENDPTIHFPAITDALQELDTMMPLLNMLQYEDNLISHGVAYVNSVMGIQEEFFVDVVGMPLGAVCPFLATTHQLIHQAKTGKGRAVDNSNKENEDPSDGCTPEIC